MEVRRVQLLSNPTRSVEYYEQVFLCLSFCIGNTPDMLYHLMRETFVCGPSQRQLQSASLE